MNRAIAIAPNALVILIGAAGSGKSTFAERWLPAEAIVSSDALRASTPRSGKKRRLDVFEPLLNSVDQRLARGALAVVDATNTDWMRRSQLIELARRHSRPTVAIVFGLALEECVIQNRNRSEKRVPASVVRNQVDAIARDLDRLDLEGFGEVHVLRSRSERDAVTVEIKRGPVARASSS